MPSGWLVMLLTSLLVSGASSQDEDSVRLVDGNIGNGKIQIWRNNRWQMYCRLWDIRESRVVCRQLGFPDALSTSAVFGTYSKNHGGNFYRGNYYYTCDGLESSLSECILDCCDYYNSCDYDYTFIWVTCTNITKPSIRLAGGGSVNKGRVEVWTGYNWIPIVKQYWTEKEAEVTCRQLGFIGEVISFGSSAGYTRDLYGESHSTVCSKGAKCSGTESTINDCKEHLTSTYCNHLYDVSVECNPKREDIVCHCLTSSVCNMTTGRCSDGLCSEGWAGEYCQTELPRISEAPTILDYGHYDNALRIRYITWQPWSSNDTGVGPVIGYSIYYVDTSQFEYEEVLVESPILDTIYYNLDYKLSRGRQYKIGISCLIKIGNVTAEGPLSPMLIFNTSGTGEPELDFLVLNQNPVVELNDAKSRLRIGGYTMEEDKTDNIILGRRVGVDGAEVNWLDDGILLSNDSAFPPQSVVSRRVTHDFIGLMLQFPANTYTENIGVFYSWSTIGLQSSNITTFTISKEANVRARSKVIIAGVGERVVMEMEIERNKNPNTIRWIHNGVEILNEWNGKTNLIFESVRTKDGGMYECYFDGEREFGLQGIVQLIVRECPSPKWGSDCQKDCPICYNGGICHPITGKCVCVSGFKGQDCSEPCGDNNFGRLCSAICSSSNRGCDAITFCLPEPMGCSCMAGYKGADCNELCSYGTFGADCRSTCHCKFNACDRAMGCMNITCDDGFTGPQCQEYEDLTPCPVGFYGRLCLYECHCSTPGCYKNGSCLDKVCQEGWAGEDCQLAIPALRNAPRVTKSNFHSLHIEWDEWTVHDDYGLGNVTGYRLFYRYTTPSVGVLRTGEYRRETKQILDQLNPCRQYEIYVRAYRNIRGSIVQGRPSPSVFHDTSCIYGSIGITLMAPSVVDVSNEQDNVDIFAYSDALSTNIRLERTCDTGAGITGRPVSWFDGSPFPGSHVLQTMMFPKNTLVETIVEFKYHALVAKIPGESLRAKSGAYSAEILGTWTLPSQSTIIVLDKEVNPRPVERSVVVGTGDRVVLSVVVNGTDTTGLRWRYNGLEFLKEWKDKGTVIIEHARTKDSGIYECHFLSQRNRGAHSIIQLKVKECPLGKHGTACDLDCPICYNGGVCDSRTSLCVCPSGFFGSDCSQVCKPGFWGKDCSLNCNDEENGCLGKLFCPDSPLGCSCLPGFKGLDCKEGCSDGFYGADCKQVCNCPSSSCDPVAGCSPDSCFLGFHGPQCQEHFANVSCTHGMFGPLCRHRCHCKNTESCHSDGSCADGICRDEWGGENCQLALPYLAHGPSLSVAANRREISVSWFDWSFGRDYGTGPVVSYDVLYKESGSANYTMAGTTPSNTFVLNKLRPGNQYNVAIICNTIVDKQLTSGPLSPVNVVSTCKLTDQ